MRKLMIITGIAGLAGALALLALKAQPNATAESSTKGATKAATSAPATTAVATTRKAERPTLTVRQRMQQIIARDVPTLKTAADVDAYVEKLVTRAEQQGQATALEVEPAMAAIRQLQGVVGHDGVASRMAALDARLQAVTASRRVARPQLTRSDLDDRLAQLLASAKRNPDSHKTFVDQATAAIRAVRPTLDDDEIRSLSRSFLGRLAKSGPPLPENESQL